MHERSLFSTLQCLKAGTVLLSQRLKPPIQFFKSSILLSRSLLGLVPLRSVLGDSTQNQVCNRTLFNCQFVFLHSSCNESITVTQLKTKVSFMTHEMRLRNNKEIDYSP